MIYLCLNETNIKHAFFLQGTSVFGSNDNDEELTNSTGAILLSSSIGKKNIPRYLCYASAQHVC